MKHQLVTAALALGVRARRARRRASYRRGALVGAAISGLTALASIVAIGRFARAGAKPVQRALAVMTVAFLAPHRARRARDVLVVRAGREHRRLRRRLLRALLRLRRRRGRLTSTPSAGERDRPHDRATLLTLALSLSLAQHGEHGAPPSSRPPPSRPRRAAPGRRAARRDPGGGARRGAGPRRGHGAAGHGGGARREPRRRDDAPRRGRLRDRVPRRLRSPRRGRDRSPAWDCELDLHARLRHDLRAGRRTEDVAGPLVFGDARHDADEARRDDVDRLADPRSSWCSGALRRKALVPTRPLQLRRDARPVRPERDRREEHRREGRGPLRPVPRHRLLLHPLPEPVRPRALRRHRDRATSRSP